MLYLDTARLGQTSPSALQAQIDFSRLTAEQPSSLYTDRFLATGFNSVPVSWHERFSGLAHWQGVTELLEAIKRVASAPVGHEVVVASRSQALMRTASRAMFRMCRNVLTTDFDWPAYHAEICDAAARSNNRITHVECRQELFTGSLTSSGLVDVIAETYERNGCDGLFLPLIDNLGFRLPIREIVSRLNSIRAPRFVFIDGAQALGHLPYIDCHDLCDVFLAGAHKWMCAGCPMGIAIFGRPRSTGLLSSCFQADSPTFDDPLSRFARSLSSGATERFSETVNVAPLLACRSAIADMPAQISVRHQHWLDQLRNRDDVATVAEGTGWQTLHLDKHSRTGILLLRSNEDQKLVATGDSLREALADCGIAVSTYDPARVRLSMPKRRLVPSELQRIEAALAKCGRRQPMSVISCGANTAQVIPAGQHEIALECRL